MIIVSMGAGLGNQLFEYAFYTYLKLVYPDQILKLDTEYAFSKVHNGIEIFDIFNLEKIIATKEEVMSLTNGHYLNGEGFSSLSFYERAYRRLGFCPKSMMIQNNYSEYYEKFFKVESSESKYFLGPFANYKYFRNCQDLIKDLYSFPPICEEHNIKIEEEISSCNSVSIHIRRGDYLTVGANLVPLEYYYEAINLIESKINDAHYFVFSDDKSYVESVFDDKKKYTIVDGNSKESSYRDMQLMSLCKHNIIANSTFSFWAAFLNNNNERIVIAPNIPIGAGSQLFVCDGWIVL